MDNIILSAFKKHTSKYDSLEKKNNILGLQWLQTSNTKNIR